MPLTPPPPEVIWRWYRPLVEFVTRLERLHAAFPAWYVTSWYRTPARNVEVGGAPLSQHLIGLAVDVVGPPEEKREVMRRVRQAGLVALDEGDHVHVQFYASSSNPLRT